MGAQTPRGTVEPKDVLLMASTIGPIDAGNVGALEDPYLAKTGVLVRHAGAGTGAALEMTKRGGFDLVMLHARALEDRFVAEGFGVDRRDVMYNAFVILGPAADPAGIRGEQRPTVALEKIARGQALFVTRGDNSGTHVKEQECWEKAGRKPAGPWYVTDAGGGGRERADDALCRSATGVRLDGSGHVSYPEERDYPPVAGGEGSRSAELPCRHP